MSFFFFRGILKPCLTTLPAPSSFKTFKAEARTPRNYDNNLDTISDTNSDYVDISTSGTYHDMSFKNKVNIEDRRIGTHERNSDVTMKIDCNEHGEEEYSEMKFEEECAMHKQLEEHDYSNQRDDEIEIPVDQDDDNYCSCENKIPDSSVKEYSADIPVLSKDPPLTPGIRSSVTNQEITEQDEEYANPTDDDVNYTINHQLLNNSVCKTNADSMQHQNGNAHKMQIINKRMDNSIPLEIMENENIYEEYENTT